MIHHYINLLWLLLC